MNFANTNGAGYHDLREAVVVASRLGDRLGNHDWPHCLVQECATGLCVASFPWAFRELCMAWDE